MTVYGASPVKRSRRTKAQLDQLDEVILAAVAADSPVTVRGVFYRVLSQGAIPKSEQAYRTVQTRVLALRRSGRIDYDHITDGTRWVYKPTTYDSLNDALEATARFYRRSLWRASPFRLYLFSEKDAISSVVASVTERWDVSLGIQRGYASESFAYTTAQTLDPRRINIVAQLGDHDPSGVNAWNSFMGKVRELTPPSTEVRFERLAVTKEQIEYFRLPMRKTKKSDTRSKGWEGGSVEVDAIPAPELRLIVEDWIASYIDSWELDVLEIAEKSEREILWNLAGRQS